MQAKKQNKNNSEIYQEFNVPRFLWSFCVQWVHAKKAGLLETFWGDVRNGKNKYDNENPGGRRVQSVGRPSSFDPNIARPSAIVPSIA
jgi:hypothetical protein